jgi:hypothetical protein
MSSQAMPRQVRRLLPVKLLALPDLASLSRKTRSHLDRAERRFGSFGEAELIALKAWLSGVPARPPDGPDPELGHLEHRLAPHFRWSASDSAPRAGQSLGEIDILFGDRFAPSDPARWTPQDLQQHLLRLSSLAGGADRFRDGAMLTRPDGEGASRLYPSVAEARGRIWELSALVQGSSPPAFRAMVAMVAVTNAHVLADGNGRASRLLFNWILHTDTGGRCYVPIYELALRTRGSFVICVREAEMSGQWGPLARYLAGALEHLSARVGRLPNG